MSYIENLIEEKQRLNSQIIKLSSLIDEIIFEYHEKLINCNFYKEYKINGEALDIIFWIRANSLPKQDHGEGDYIRIDLDIEDGNLELYYSCSYRSEENHTLISIPLDIMDNNDDSILTDFILEEVIKKEEKVAANKKKHEKENKVQRIALLEKELKELKKK